MTAHNQSFYSLLCQQSARLERGEALKGVGPKEGDARERNGYDDDHNAYSHLAPIHL